MRIPLSKLASCIGGRWKIPGTGVVTIVDYHPSTVQVRCGSIKWMIPLHDLRRIADPLGRPHNATTPDPNSA
jgi:hypothetical protein